MALQNIGASNKNDAFYRYKMPKMVIKIEGRGNGIKTNLVNMVDVAKALARPAAYTTKYFGCELGAQSRFDDKTGTATVNGAHDMQKLGALLENFIKKYVQCYSCGNPETDIVITKNQMIHLKCAACGFVSDVDMRDKLTTYILKNPPEPKKKSSKKLTTSNGEPKKVKKESKEKKTHEKISKKKSGSDAENSPPASQGGDSENAESEDDVQWQTDTSVMAAQQRIQEQLTSVTSEMVMPNTFTEGAFMTETNVHANLVMDFVSCLQKGYTDDELVAHLNMLLAQSPEQDVMNAYFESLFHKVDKGLADKIKKKKLFLTKAVTDDLRQKLLLVAFETFCASHKDVIESRKDINMSLSALYEFDIIEEDAILEWYESCGTSNVKELAAPFVEWLQTAEEE